MLFKMKLFIVGLCIIHSVLSLAIEHGSNNRGGKKLFGGYRITPRFCKATRNNVIPSGGPNICMFNHECLQRNGRVVGACMDGFLFGACCQVMPGVVGTFIEGEQDYVNITDNNLSEKSPPTVVTEHAPPEPTDDITNSLSHITQTLLNHEILPTAEDNMMVQLSQDQSHFTTTGITQHSSPETSIMNSGMQLFTPIDLISAPTKKPVMEDRKTTLTSEETTLPYSHDSPIITISISNGPSVYTPRPGFVRPMFHLKPTKAPNDEFVLIPTIKSKKNETEEIGSIVNILQILNETSTNSPYSSSIYFTSPSKPLSSSSLYGHDASTSRKPPSTSYVFSTKIPPRRTTSRFPSSIKSKPTSPTTHKIITKPSKTSNKKTSTKKPYSINTGKPVGHSTFGNSPSAFVTTKKPPSTSYVFSSTPPRRPPPSIRPISTHIAGPGFSVTSEPLDSVTSGNYPNPAPTLIVLGPVTEEYDRPISSTRPVTYQNIGGSSEPTKRPGANHVTINNHITQNIYSTTERPSYYATSQRPSYYGSSQNPSPTVLITPKPSSITPSGRPPSEFITAAIEFETTGNDLINFPPVRNPNLNMTQYGENEITTPVFVEDEALNDKMESFVNKIIQGLQEPFEGLKDVVYNHNITNVPINVNKKPNKKQGSTTKKPSFPKSTSIKPASSSIRPSGNRVTTRKPSTRKPTTRKPSVSTRKPTSTTYKQKVTKVTKKPVTTTTKTTTLSYIEVDEPTPAIASDDYRRGRGIHLLWVLRILPCVPFSLNYNVFQSHRAAADDECHPRVSSECGKRPLLRSARIVGGKGATFGEWPWQVLVRESTWLGLFTKNKCGGVLISNKYVMTAAHCQPGFLASLVTVFGEYDISGDLESKRSISRNVKRVIVNRGYDAATFANDLALLELESPILFDQHIIPICLPRDNEDFTSRMATVTGWGRLKYGGGVPSVLQEVQVPIMENHVCQEMFRTAGHSKVILDSFLCAGYANGQKDSCEGDSGGPLVLQRPDGRYQLAGTVSHGIKCAAPYLPGVYMRTQYYKPWIESITGIN